MLSFTLPTLTEDLLLSGTTITVYPLPLFFRARVQRIYISPPHDGDSPDISIERTLYLLRLSSIHAVEALRESGAIQYGDDQQGRPDWGDLIGWTQYAGACMDALTMAGFGGEHITAIRDAYERLESRGMEGLDLVGNG